MEEEKVRQSLQTRQHEEFWLVNCDDHDIEITSRDYDTTSIFFHTKHIDIEKDIENIE